MISGVWGGANYQVTQPWGATTLTVEPYWQAAQSHWHCGIDIGMYSGTPLFAARGGTVVAVSYGLLGIRVGTQTDYYIHIDRSVVAVGRMVAAGALVAYSGAKIPAGGSLTGPHLHFEVQDGALNNPATSCDPVPILSGTHGAATGQGDIDLTPEQDSKLHEIWAVIKQGYVDQPPADNPANLWWLSQSSNNLAKAIADLKLEVEAIKGASGSPDVTVLGQKIDALAGLLKNLTLKAS